VTAVIPARFGSTRFPGKPLLRETGKFLIQHVYERVRAACRIGRCIVATDDPRIVAAVESFGGEVRLTRPDHPSGTDRVAEVAAALGGRPDDVVVNVQGDEPEIEPEQLDRLVERLIADVSCPLATLACPFPAGADPADPSAVKVVLDRGGQALYFSRAPIPYEVAGDPRPIPPPSGAGEPATGQPPTRERNAGYLLHLGVYAFRRAFLFEFAGWPASPLERKERLEQLRVLEHGRSIAVEIVERAAVGIDTPADYARFVERWNRRTDAGRTAARLTN